MVIVQTIDTGYYNREIKQYYVEAITYWMEHHQECGTSAKTTQYTRDVVSCPSIAMKARGVGRGECT